jgi:DNA-binding NarL/FixJ family response regulator
MNLISPEALSVVSKITGIWLDSLGLTSAFPRGDSVAAPTASPESLTERQLTVLRLMAEGKTNAQIAQELILSESTIRQETVKIYRALGVHARSEAGKRAKHLGIIDRVAI